MFTPIPVAEFLGRTGLDTEADLFYPRDSVTQVVSLRQLEIIDCVQLMHHQYLRRLLESVVCKDGKTHPYTGKWIGTMNLSARSARVGQRFIERGKYTALVERFQQILEGFATPSGPTGLGAFIAFGRMQDGTRVVAHYLPPIIEIGRDNGSALLDGIHRNYPLVGAGLAMPMLTIRDVEAPLPFDLRDWDEVEAVDVKPPVEERFFNLRPEMFRDLKYVGIDG
ncbi:MAG TPA: hypothetical protein VGB97_01155 [Candidatus Paceibacterota bacterium]